MDPGKFGQSDAVEVSWQHALLQNETSMEEELGQSPPPYESVIDMNAAPGAPIWQQDPHSNSPRETTPVNMVPAGGGDGRGAQTASTEVVGCFGCCSLETCCKVQGYLTAVGSVLGCILAIFLIVGPFIIEATDRGYHRHDDEETELYVFMAIMGIILLVGSIITFVCAVRFIKGVNQRVPHMMVPYIRMLYVHLVLQVLTIFRGPDYIAQGILSLAFTSYNVILARSLHQKMVNESENQIRNKNDA